jgi:hypothetical protein
MLVRCLPIASFRCGAEFGRSSTISSLSQSSSSDVDGFFFMPGTSRMHISKNDGKILSLGQWDSNGGITNPWGGQSPDEDKANEFLMD